MRHLLIFVLAAVSLPSCGRDNIDWKAIDSELKVSIPAGTTRTDAFSRKLEQWMARVGMPITIDHSRENSLYLFPFTIAAGASDNEFQKILAQTPGASSREDFVKMYLENRRIDSLSFDRSQWDAKQHSNTRQRYRLFKGYCAKKSPIGMTRAEIEGDLGATSAAPNSSGISYYLGADLGIGIDSLTVVLSLKDGKITEYKFVTD